jgi:HAD superfamily hydrolase (TIGR01509 family)
VSGTGKIRAIIFDIGRVIIQLDLRRVQEGLSKGLPLSPEELWSAVEKDPRWNDWQEGRMSARDWHQNLSNRLGIPLSFEQFTTVWNSTLDPEPMLSNELFEALAKKYCVALLSNTDKIHVAHIEASYNFVRHVPPAQRIYSCSIGVSKPNPLIYREALRACKVKAGEAVYIDDIAANVDAARQLGLAGIQFQSPTQLLKDLAAMGVQIPISVTK